MRYLIVNADDFGYSEEVNTAILRAHREGVLTSTSLMVAEPGCEHAVAIARQTPALGVGLHLVVSYDRALLPIRDVPLLVDSAGRFGADPFRVAWLYHFNRKAQAQLKQEMAAQFARFASFNLEWSHVDGHQHFHLHPVVWDTLLDLCDTYHVHRLRVPREDTRSHFVQRKEEKKSAPSTLNPGVHPQGRTQPSTHLEGFSLNTVSSLALRALRRRNLRVLERRQTLGGKPMFCCERVYGQLQTGNMHEAYTLELLNRLHVPTNEIYFHPGTAHARVLPVGLQRDNVRDVELHTLLSPAVRARIEALGLQTGTYAQIEAASQHSQPAPLPIRPNLAANKRE